MAGKYLFGAEQRNSGDFDAQVFCGSKRRSESNFHCNDMLGGTGWSPIRRHFHLAFHTDQSCTEGDKDRANYTTAINDEFGVRRTYSCDKDKQCRRHHPTTKQANNERIGEPSAFFDAEERSATGATVCFFTISPIIAQRF